MTIQALSSYALPTAADMPADKVSWTFDPARAVLLIHDMQDYFVGFYGAGNPTIAAATEAMVAVRRHLRSIGVPVVYTAQPPEQSDADRGLLNDMWGPGLTRQPDKAGIVAALAPEDGDRVLTKWRYSAFFRSDLAEIMAQEGRDQLLIGGIYGHIGVLQTAVDAFMRGIKPFLIADAIADFSREDHLWALRYVARNAGRTVLSADLLQAGAAVPLTKDALRARLLSVLDDAPGDGDNLLDFGLDSIAVMKLVEEWKAAGLTVGFAELAMAPTIDGWWALLDGKQRRDRAA
ncbi:bifunctional isochorismate lyase/aryl carrier protein [Azospirillum fermentarium]|uniref:isochorismatase family protein n=1 Tax=Azospirillum fermentarium TaxID=1233114 RepID=UPI002225FB03|nr:isochorismatase family protein [Azospirillum fermentarium]MCW2246587.1 bifunctional isochorismate lyase/aryl carrier protein [Azospirillum fermentarium]